MAFQHHRDRKLTIRKLSCIDHGRVFVCPIRGESTTSQGSIFNIDDVTTPDDIVQVDLGREEVYIYSPKQ